MMCHLFSGFGRLRMRKMKNKKPLRK